MNDILDVTPVINARTKVFAIDEVGEFTLHRPTVGDHIKIGRLVTAYGGGNQMADIDANILVKVKAILETIADEKPRGFVFDNCEDPMPLWKFWGDYSAWLESFRPSQTPDTSA